MRTTQVKHSWSRWTAEDANEGDDLESFYLCPECTSGAVSLDWTIDVQNAETGEETKETVALMWLEDINYDDEECMMCGTCPADEEEDDEDDW